MSLVEITNIESIVLESCKDLIDQFHFTLQRRLKNEVYLLSKKCGIRIMAGVSPIGERQIDIDFYSIKEKISSNKAPSDKENIRTELEGIIEEKLKQL